MASIEDAAAAFAEGTPDKPLDEQRLIVARWQPGDWAELFRRAEALPIAAGRVLIQKDAAERALYFVASGLLEVTVVLSGQTLATIAKIKPGSVVGELAFLDGKPRSAKVWAVTDSTLYRLEYDAYLKFADEHPALACELVFGIARLVALRLRRMMASGGR
jgi:CRP/FNR family transcriptional regulator, cyclic AMP receptor protein